MDTIKLSDTSILNLFGQEDEIKDDYTISKVTDHGIDNRMVELELKNEEHVKLILDNPWLLNGNYSTINSVLAFDKNGNSHHALCWIIANQLKQVMPIADSNATNGYSIYSAKFTKIDGSSQMHLNLRNFRHINGDILKFPPPTSDPVNIDTSSLKYSDSDPMANPITTVSNYNKVLTNAEFDEVADVEIGNYDSPFDGKLPKIHKGQPQVIEDIELRITYCSFRYMIDSAQTSSSSKALTRPVYVRNGKTIEEKQIKFNMNYFKFNKSVYQSSPSPYTVYDSLRDMTRPKSVNFRQGIYDAISMKLVGDIKSVSARVSISTFNLYTVTIEGKVRVLLFRKSNFASSEEELVFTINSQEYNIKKLKVNAIYKIGADVEGHKEGFDRYIIENRIYISPDKEYIGTVFKRVEIPNPYIEFGATIQDFLRKAEGYVKYYDYGKFKGQRLDPLPEFSDKPSLFIIKIHGVLRRYKAFSKKLTTNRILDKHSYSWRDSESYLNVEELEILTPIEASKLSGYPGAKGLKDVVIRLFRPSDLDSNMIIVEGEEQVESFSSTDKYNAIPKDLQWKTYDAAPYIIRQFLRPNNYPVMSSLFNVIPTTKKNTVRCLLKPANVHTDAETYLTDVCSKMNFKKYTNTENDIVNILELFRGKFVMDRYIQGREWDPIKFTSEDVLKVHNSNMNPRNIDHGAVEDMHLDLYDLFIERVVRTHKSWIPKELASSINYLAEEHSSRQSSNTYEDDLYKAFSVGPAAVLVNTGAMEALTEMLEYYSLRAY